MKSPIIVDLRNLFDPSEVSRAGVGYVSIGRPVRHYLDDVVKAMTGVRAEGELEGTRSAAA